MNRLLLAALLSISIVYGQQPICTVEHPPLDEQSSIVKSTLYEDVFWITNDSGDGPYLYGVTVEGEIIIPNYLKNHYARKKKDYPGIKIIGAVQHDWESLTMLGDTIVVADMGNNANVRRDMGVYLIPEPNPYEVSETRALVWIPIHYPEQQAYPPADWTFDCEAIFTFKGKLYFLTKHRQDQNLSKPAAETILYRLDTRHTTQSNPLKKIGTAENLGGWVTAADMAPDGSGLVFLAQNILATTVWYYPTPRRADNFLAGPAKKLVAPKLGQAEGVCFSSNSELIISNEQRSWFSVSLSDFK